MCKYCENNTKTVIGSPYPLYQVDAETQQSIDVDSNIVIPKKKQALFMDTHKWQDDTNYIFIDKNFLVVRYIDYNFCGDNFEAIIEHIVPIKYCPVCGRKLN